MDETIVHETPMAAAVTVAHPAPTGANPGSPVSLLTREESEQLRTRWMEIQGKFVDEPRPAVQEADELVSEVVKKIIQMFASEHNSLEGQWNRGVDVSTEDLRQALQHYRSFFNRLVV
jgi:Na+/phosphate symporter